MNNWYVFSNDKVLGPYTQQQVQSLLDTNQLAMQDKICEADKQIWRMVSEFPEFNQQRKKGLWNRIFSNEDKKRARENLTRYENLNKNLGDASNLLVEDRYLQK